MTGNIMDNPGGSWKYQKALQNLYTGAVMPWDREILSAAPLPEDIVEPFASQDIDPKEIMRYSYISLIGWISESKRTNYFSKRFIQLSRLVMNGVITMGRGLVTLHNRGENLSQAPMSIGDLISTASYQFRKSYLGAVQTSGKQPEVGERLLMNQLQWANMLLRLYKTRDKLESDVRKVISEQCPVQNEEDNTALKDPDANNDADNSMLSQRKKSLLISQSGIQNTGLPGIDAIFEPAPLSAPRALSSFGRSGKKEVFRLAADRDQVITQTEKSKKEESIPVSADSEPKPEQNELPPAADAGQESEAGTKTEPQTGEDSLLTEEINNYHESDRKSRDQFPIRFDSG